MNNNNQFPREMNSGYSGNPDLGGSHHMSDAHKHQESVGAMPSTHSEGLMKSNQDNRYELGQQNTTNMYGSSYMGPGQTESSLGFNQNQTSSQGNFGMDRNMMGYSNINQNQPSIGQRNYQSYSQPGYGFPQMSNEMPSDMGGMMHGSMPHSYMQSSKAPLPGIQSLGMSSSPGGYHGEKTYEPGISGQTMSKPYESHSDVPLPIEILRDYEEKAAKCKQYKQTEVFAAILLKNEDDTLKVIDHLVKKGVSLTATDALDQTALFYAARDGKIRVLSMLLEAGCSPNHKDQYGQTAIYYAARENQLEIAQKLIDGGADLNNEDMHQQTCLFYAAKSGNIDMCAKLIDCGVNINHMDNKRQTALHWANKSKKMETVDYLISRGASPINRKTDRKRGNIKKKMPNERKEPKKYVLTTFVDGQWLPLAEEEDFLKLEKECPEVANIIKNPTLLENLEIPEVPEEAPIYDHWEKPAKRIINNLWKQEGAWLFHFPVDVKAWKIEDYYTIIKDPMDFTTIKGKLSNNEYKSVDEFVIDVNKVFNNCIIYNGESNQYSQTAKKMRKEFENQYNSLCMDFYKAK